MKVKAKKYLGQHFLRDESIAQRIAETLTSNGYSNVLEVGPGMGVMTKYLLENPSFKMKVVELDTESVDYLYAYYPQLCQNIISADFLQLDLETVFQGQEFALTGNYPYNISSQILFKAVENRHLIPELTGMFQKEVAERAVSKHGSKVYGILSVLLQVYYEGEYLFTVDQNVFDPPPKVKSGVIRFVRRNDFVADFDEILFVKVVKAGFNQRRKTMRNALKVLGVPLDSLPFMDLRAEQLSVEDFKTLTRAISRVK